MFIKSLFLETPVFSALVKTESSTASEELLSKNIRLKKLLKNLNYNLCLFSFIWHFFEKRVNFGNRYFFFSITNKCVVWSGAGIVTWIIVSELIVTHLLRYQIVKKLKSNHFIFNEILLFKKLLQVRFLRECSTSCKYI